MKKFFFFSPLIPVLLCFFLLNSTSAQQPGTGILFLNFHVTKTDGDQNRKIELVSHHITDGQLTGARANPVLNLPGQKIRCALLDASGQTIYQAEVQDPLLRDYEYADESGHLQHVTVASEEGDFSLRLPNSKAYRQVRLETISDEKVITVQSLTLNLE